MNRSFHFGMNRWNQGDDGQSPQSNQQGNFRGFQRRGNYRRSFPHQNPYRQNFSPKQNFRDRNHQHYGKGEIPISQYFHPSMLEDPWAALLKTTEKKNDEIKEETFKEFTSEPLLELQEKESQESAEKNLKEKFDTTCKVKDDLEKHIELLQIAEKCRETREKYENPLNSLELLTSGRLQETPPILELASDDGDDDFFPKKHRNGKHDWNDVFSTEMSGAGFAKENTPEKKKKTKKSPLSPKNVFVKPKSAKKTPTSTKWLSAFDSASDSTNSFCFEKPGKRSKIRNSPAKSGKKEQKMRQTKLNFTRTDPLDIDATFCEDLLNATPENHDTEAQMKQVRRRLSDRNTKTTFHLDSASVDSDDTIFIEDSQERVKSPPKTPKTPKVKKCVAGEASPGVLREFQTPAGYWDIGFPPTAPTQPESPTVRRNLMRPRKKL
ncbi:hypothetical protein DMENIID0001_144370 [Sergentomyia squamirostris]